MNKLKGAFYGIASSATFGLIPLFTLPLMKSGWGYHAILFYRYFLAALILGLILGIRKISLKVTPRELGILFLLSVFAMLSALFLIQGYGSLPSGVATTIHFLYPVFVAIIMMLFFREKKSLPVFISIALAITGVALLSLNEAGGSFSLFGITIVAISALTYAIYLVGINKSSIKRMNALKFTFYIMFLGALQFFILSLYNGDFQLITRGSDFTNAFLLALLPTVISNFTLVCAISHIGSTMTAILGAMESVTAVTIGIFVFHEPFSAYLLLGLICVLGSVNIIILSSYFQQKAAKNTAPIPVK